jgi:hypothetical protein
LPIEIDHRGEGLPSLTHKVLLALIKAKRRTPSLKEQEAILVRQDNRCALCDGIFDCDVEFDHQPPLRQCGLGQLQLFQALCASCHLEKTISEQGNRADRSIQSRFAPSVWEAYVKTPRPPPLVWRAHVPKQKVRPGDPDPVICELDVRRCRRNALAKSAHDMPVFCPLESEPGKLCDFTYVIPRVLRKPTLSQLPLTGRGWYHRVAVEFALHHGQITWDDCMWSLQATGHIPKETFNGALDIMETAWGDNLDLAKLSVNSMIGLWCMDNGDSFHCVTTKHPVAGYTVTQHFHFADKQRVIDNFYMRTSLSNATMRPIHDLIMHTEATRLAQIRFMITRQLPLRNILDVKTDALTITLGKKRKFIESLAETTFEELPNLRRKHERLEPSQRFLNDGGVTQAGCTGLIQPFDSARALDHSMASTTTPGERRTCQPPWETAWRTQTKPFFSHNA